MLLSFLLLPSLVAGLAGPATKRSDTHHLPLFRRTPQRRDGVVDVDQVVRSVEWSRLKHGLKARSDGSLSRRASTADLVPLDQDADSAYLTTIQVGTPPQSLDVSLDTGSSDLWFHTTACTNCSTAPGLDVSQSSSILEVSSAPLTIHYGGGNATGTVFSDTVTLGPYTVPNTTFAGVTQVTGSGVISDSSVGIIGLGLIGLTSFNETPLWQVLASTGAISAPQMSFYLPRYKDVTTSATSTRPGGSFTLGGTNSSFFKGDIDFHTVLPTNQNISEGYWVQSLTGITVNGNNVDIGNATAIIDTGSTLISGPTEGVQAFWAQIAGSQAIMSGKLSGQGLYQFPCTTNVTSTFSFGGRAWSVSADDMNLGSLPDDGQSCVGALTDSLALATGPGQWVMGDTFLKNVYTVLRGGDSPAVGFAELADGFNDFPTPSGNSSGTAASSATGPSTTSTGSRSSSAGVHAVSAPTAGFLLIVLGAASGIAPLLLC
ncbi:unnamed protein product [Peniophora sp. CBMAI 1063]|nr:unnamed protein product [Peniophora sp. CBMAI 1063]